MRPSGAHTHPESGNGLAAAVAVIAAVAFVSASVPLVHALAGLLRAVLVTVIAATAVLAVAMTAAIAVCLRCHRLPRPGQPFRLITSSARPVSTISPPRAVGAPAVHLHLHGITAEDAAAALAHLPIASDPPEGRLTGHA
jgi:hypothetical protein